MPEIPRKFKQIVLRNLRASIHYLLEEHPTIKNQLNIPLDLFTVSDDLRPKKEVKKFILDNQGIILAKYNALIRPRLQFLSSNTLDLAISAFDYFVDDFFEYAVYKCVEVEDIKAEFEILWRDFERDFFSNEIEMQYLARLKNLYYHGGIGLDQIIPWTGIDAYWTPTAFDYRLLGWERKGGIHYNFLENFQPSWMVLRMKKGVSSSVTLMAELSESTDKFNLFTFIVRNVAGGSVFFNDIRLFGFGHYSPFHDTGVSMYSIQDNDVYEEIGEYTTLKHPDDWFISKALKKCEKVSYSQYTFADWQIRLKTTLQTTDSFGESTTKRKFYLYNNLLGLTFVFNSLLPDLKNKQGHPSNRHNKTFRENYLPSLISGLFGMTEANVKQTIIDLYEIRNCIAHGKNLEADREFATRYGTLDKLADGLRLFEHILNNLILLSLANSTLKTTLEQWYVSKNVTILPTLTQPFSD